MTSEKQAVPPMRDAAYFDQWYADQVASPARDDIIARTLGFPPELEFSGVLTGQGVAEVTEGLSVAQDGLLLDIACGPAVTASRSPDAPAHA
jgi:hypothetical protein